MNQPDTSTQLDSGNFHSFLASYIAPIRISGIADSGYPVICSLWFEYADDAIWCATQKTSKIARILSRNPKCAFELAPNEPPYFGVRGRGQASVQSENADELLERLIRRYLGDTKSRLAKILLKNVANEVALRIEPSQVFSWDYRNRMQN